MDDQTQALIFEHITQEWRSLQTYSRPNDRVEEPPWGVWIQRYESRDDLDKELVVEKVWFLDKSGIRERDIWEFVRFIVVTWERPWFTGHNMGLREGIWRTLYSDLGVAAFGNWPGTNEIYLEMQWGTLHGGGYLARVEDGLLKLEKRIWIS